MPLCPFEAEMVCLAIDKLTPTEINPRFAPFLEVVTLDVVALWLARLWTDKPILRLPATISVPVAFLANLLVLRLFPQREDEALAEVKWNSWFDKFIQKRPPLLLLLRNSPIWPSKEPVDVMLTVVSSYPDNI